MEMRSTADWKDVRYRAYTTSVAKAEAFKRVPKIQFTDSGHGVVPVVKEMASGERRERRITDCEAHVRAAFIGMHLQKPKAA
jgi:hypothetical protein